MIRGAEFLPYIGKQFNRDVYPHVPIAERQESANCITLVHQVYEEQFGCTFSKGFWSKEMYQDEVVYLQSVSPNGRIYLGDIFVFGTEDPQLHKLHVAVFTGEQDVNRQPLLIHATGFAKNTSEICSLSELMRESRHERLYAVKRLQPALFDAYIRPLI